MDSYTIEKTIIGIKDITDPSSMDTIHMIYQQIQEEDDEYISLLVEKLKDETIYWEQPWYQRVSLLTRNLQQDHCEAEPEVTFLKDSICKDEHDQIIENWHKLVKEYEIPDKLVSLCRWKSKHSRRSSSPYERMRRFVVSYLARGLERTLYQVFKYMLAQWGVISKGAYNVVENKLLEICFYHNPRNLCPIVSRILGREPRAIYKKQMQEFYGKPVKKKLKWELPLATKFLKLLMKHSNLTFEELKYQKFETSVWLKVQDEMDQYYEYLQRFWYSSLHVQLFVNCDVKLYKLRKEILKKLKANTKYNVWTDIRWKDLTLQFPDGFTHYFIYRLTIVICSRYPKYLIAPLHKVLDYALNAIRAHKYRNKRLRRLRLNSKGNLEIINKSE